VRSICGAFPASNYSDSILFTTLIAYCAANGNNDSYEYISNVQIGSWNNTSGDGTDGTGYSNFTGVTPTDIEVDTQYTITITPEWPSSTYNEGYAVWIDYDRDGTFETSERIFQNSATNAASVSGNFTVPSGLTAGVTRMRVLMDDATTPNDPCDSFDYGEVEDYMINIVVGTLSTTDNVLETTQVFPNPFNNLITIKLPSNYNSNAIGLVLYDISGRIITKLDNQTPQNSTLTINHLNRISSGTYFIEITNNEDGHSIIKRLIKN
ncbi:GEVED domain-containing protein, partial [Lacinutrix iliipiscaria]